MPFSVCRGGRMLYNRSTGVDTALDLDSLVENALGVAKILVKICGKIGEGIIGF